MRYVVIALIVLAVALISATAYVFYASKRIPSSDYEWARVRVRDAEFRVRIADTMPKQVRGLSGYAKLDEDEGMFFVFATSTPRTFWMKEMNFPIDIIWIQDGKITGFAEDAKPQSGVSDFNLKAYASPGGANRVLEVSAGMVEKKGITVGDTVVVQ